MRKYFVAAVSGMALLAGAASAQDRQEINIDSFDELEAWGGYEIEVVHGDTPGVVLVGDADDFDDIEISVHNGRLEVEQDGSFFGRRRSLDVAVQVTFTELRAIEFSRGISARVSGVSARDLEVSVSTGSSARIVGSCTDLELDASTGASLNASRLVCETADAEASTGASASLHATDSVRARASMGADLRVHGSPSRHEIRSTMGGSVRLASEG